MAKFLTGNELNSEIEKTFGMAKKSLVLISPYIKLHDRYASTLKTKINGDELSIIIVFGKNEEDMSKSMIEADFNFFKQFPNIEIRYEKRLHAKYYANDNSSILTSMNLYSFSQDNNIEAGILTKGTLLGGLANMVLEKDNFEDQAADYFKRVIDQSALLFKKIPEYDNTMFGLSSKYKGSKIVIDKLSDFFSGKSKSKPKENEKKEILKNNTGYCIRTGKEIPFDIKLPFTKEAFENWSKYKNEEFKEKFCHFTGEPSNGETNFAKPILAKNYKKALEFHKTNSKAIK